PEGVGEGGGEGAAAEWIVRERPRVRFADVAGLDTVKDEIRVKMIYPFSHPDQADRYKVRKGGGLLLYGPPGTGKTLVARAIAGELDAIFFSITPSRILSKWVGEAEKNVQALFESARACERAVIFIDEIESLVPKRRTTQSTVMERVVPQILAELDGFEGRPSSLLFVGATNEPWSLDYAVLRPGRFDAKVYVGLPDAPARLSILRMNTSKVPLAPDVDLDALAARVEGYSGADVAHLCRTTAERIFKECVETSHERPIAQADFLATLAALRPSVALEDLKRFESWRGA
ncbi:MAG: ATP-binding protein, partial [Planctomycetes bacterium]|nr:ATP-binding protein [Planctomycetota bacterium]